MLTPAFRKIERFHQEEFTPIHRSFRCDVSSDQLQLPLGSTDNLYTTYHGHVKMGQFFEFVTQALFGGELCDSVINYKNNGIKGGVKPDVLLKTSKIALESKANRSGHQMNLLDDQMQRYRMFQLLNEEYRMYFCFYRHGFERIKNTRLSTKELSEAISKKIYALIMLPFDIVWTMWKADHIFKRYVTNVWHHYTRIGSPAMNKFLFVPYQAFPELGLNLHRYEIKRYKSPVEFRVEGCSIDPFLILTIKSLHYEEWVKKHIINHMPF